MATRPLTGSDDMSPTPDSKAGPLAGLSGNTALTTPVPDARAFKASGRLRCGRLKPTATGSICVIVSIAGPLGATLLPANTAIDPTRPPLAALMRAKDS